MTMPNRFFITMFYGTVLVVTLTSVICILQGITYDTGGADIKAGGVMAGMHRDKCGAATVTGFFKVTHHPHNGTVTIVTQRELTGMP